MANHLSRRSTLPSAQSQMTPDPDNHPYGLSPVLLLSHDLNSSPRPRPLIPPKPMSPVHRLPAHQGLDHLVITDVAETDRDPRPVLRSAWRRKWNLARTKISSMISARSFCRNLKQHRSPVPAENKTGKAKTITYLHLRDDPALNL